jgi:hypothetical protein
MREKMSHIHKYEIEQSRGCRKLVLRGSDALLSGRKLNVANL